MILSTKTAINRWPRGVRVLFRAVNRAKTREAVLTMLHVGSICRCLWCCTPFECCSGQGCICMGDCIEQPNAPALSVRNSAARVHTYRQNAPSRLRCEENVRLMAAVFDWDNGDALSSTRVEGFVLGVAQRCTKSLRCTYVHRRLGQVSGRIRSYAFRG